MFLINSEAFFRQYEDLFIKCGFQRKAFFFYRKHGNSFQCITVGRGCPDTIDHEIFLVVFPFWTGGLRRISAWPSFEEAYLHPELFRGSTLGWPSYGIEITGDFYDCGESKDYNDAGFSFFEKELLPFLNGINDNNSFKEAMASLNRHSRVFEELILLESLKEGSLDSAEKWLESAKKRDAMSIKAVAESVYSPKNDFEINYYKSWGLNSFDDALDDAKKAVKRTHDMFYGKLIQAVQAKDCKWVKELYPEEQRKAVAFFKDNFNIEYEIEQV
ncbi:MAG: hypothetical protein J6112_09690 [Clostridia bacterium]|nr:hypothetical protein [Clostridia bacterium]